MSNNPQLNELVQFTQQNLVENLRPFLGQRYTFEMSSDNREMSLVPVQFEIPASENREILEPCTVYVQSNLNAVESQKIQRAAEGLGLHCKLFKLRPFMDRCPRLNAKDPFILIGSTTLNRNALKSAKYRRGVFFNQNFKPQVYAKHYGHHYMNCGQRIFKLKDIPEFMYAPDERVFVRSNDDSKDISGGTLLWRELLDIKQNTEQHWVGGDLFSPQCEVCIAPLQNIYAEYRLIVCEKEIVGYSRYQPSVHYSVPGDVLDFGRKMIDLWGPHDVYVLDVVETDNGLKVMECNCVNGSGWYDANYEQVLYALTTYQSKRKLYRD